MGKMKIFPISIRIWEWVPGVFSGVLGVPAEDSEPLQYSHQSLGLTSVERVASETTQITIALITSTYMPTIF